MKRAFSAGVPRYGILLGAEQFPLDDQGLASQAFGFGQAFYGPAGVRFGRRPVILWGIGVYVLVSIGCGELEKPNLPGVGVRSFHASHEALSTPPRCGSIWSGRWSRSGYRR